MECLYSRHVKLKWKLFQVAVLTGLAAFGMGCGGVNASGSVSPATFLLPGLGHNDSTPAPDAVKGEKVMASTIVVAE
jgi:hypothetical protein